MPAPTVYALRNVLYHALCQDNSSTRREQRIFGDSQDKSGDVYHPDFAEGKPTYFDLSVSNTLQPSTINKSSSNAGAAGLRGEGRKDDKHASNVESVDGTFIPLVVESLGLWTPFAAKTLSLIAGRTTLHIK